MFTSKERDAETGLDYFGARYFSSAQGRFTSPDEFPGGIVDPFTGQQVSQPGPLPYADITDPQTLNKYGYVRNNPLRYTDPDGHDWQDAVDLVAGIGRGIAASESFGVVGAPSSSDSTASIVGQGIGTLAVGVVGAITSVGGAAGGVITSPTGVGAVAGAAVATAGAVSATGAAKNLGAVINAAMQSSGQGPKASDAAGTSASGQATDKYGNKLGGSGKPMVHETNSNTREAARNKALNEGSGAAEHSNPKEGNPHSHPTDAQGEKKPTSTHHNYPDN